jgi:ribosomal protein S18 acetylase RimI-like enzyme
MSTGIVIRAATKSDAAEIALLVNIATHGLVVDEWVAGSDLTGIYSPLEVGRSLILAEKAFSWREGWIAESGGEVAGMLLGGLQPSAPAASAADPPPFMRPILELAALAAGTWFVGAMAVHRQWRGNGLGRTLLRFADAKAVETGAPRLSLIVEDVNAPARRLYEREGYTVRDRRPMMRFPSGGPDGEDWLFMVKN